MISDRAKGTLARPTKVTIGEYLPECLATKASKKPSTQQSYKDALRPVLVKVPHVRLRDLDVPHVEVVKAGMLSGELRSVGTPGQPLSPRSVNLTLCVLGMALDAAVKRGIVARNVAGLVDRVPGDASAGKERGAWQTSDAVAFLKHVSADRLYAAWLLSLLGMRRGEVLGLRWPDVDLDGMGATEWRFPQGTPSLGIVPGGNRVLVNGQVYAGSPKSRKGERRLPSPVPVVDALKAHRAKQASERLAAGSAWDGSLGLVFVDEIGAPINPERYSDLWLAHGKAAQLPRLTLHGARHAAASLLAEMGMPDVVIAAWVGHAQVSVTHGYSHAQARQLVEAGQILGEVLAG